MVVRLGRKELQKRDRGHGRLTRPQRALHKPCCGIPITPGLGAGGKNQLQFAHIYSKEGVQQTFPIAKNLGLMAHCYLTLIISHAQDIIDRG